MQRTVARRFLQLCMLLPLALACHAAPANEQALDLATPTGTLAGTLALPAADGKVPVVLIVAGSGPTDRDGNGPAPRLRNDSLRMLATALAELAEASERILAALERGDTVDEVPAPLAALYRPSVQPYLASWMKYVPAERLAALRMPVLIVQGTTDIQVGADQAEALEAAKPDAVLALVPGMNHVLKEVPADPRRQLASYGDPALPLHPRLLERIVKFLRAVPAPPRTTPGP